MDRPPVAWQLLLLLAPSCSGTDDTDQEQMFGLHGHHDDVLTHPPAEPKPAATAMSVLAQALGDHDTIEDVSVFYGLDEQTFGYFLSGGGGEVVVGPRPVYLVTG